MTSAVGIREWMYIDSGTQLQKGPVPSNLLIKLLEKGIGVTGSTLVWKPEMESWKKMEEVCCIQIYIHPMNLQD
jgi:hypothetical protein